METKQSVASSAKKRKVAVLTPRTDTGEAPKRSNRAVVLDGAEDGSNKESQSSSLEKQIQIALDARNILSSCNEQLEHSSDTENPEDDLSSNESSSEDEDSDDSTDSASMEEIDLDSSEDEEPEKPAASPNNHRPFYEKRFKEAKGLGLDLTPKDVDIKQMSPRMLRLFVKTCMRHVDSHLSGKERPKPPSTPIYLILQEYHRGHVCLDFVVLFASMVLADYNTRYNLSIGANDMYETLRLFSGFENTYSLCEFSDMIAAQIDNFDRSL